MPHLSKFRDRLRELSDQPGVVNLGSLPQSALADIMRSSMVWAHPSWCSPFDMPFHETSCIGAMEAQAAGLHVVASDWGALRETVEAGHLITGPKSEKWAEAFVDSIVAGLTDGAMLALAERMGPLAMADKGWEGVAVDMAAIIDARVNVA
jgi:glycosyltransferase involved in cell wall biosynthesis